jgi:hypothetical protein
MTNTKQLIVFLRMKIIEKQCTSNGGKKSLKLLLCSEINVRSCLDYESKALKNMKIERTRQQEKQDKLIREKNALFKAIHEAIPRSREFTEQLLFRGTELKNLYRLILGTEKKTQKFAVAMRERTF